ncbi:MAG: hypothetical protein ACOH1K_07430, partial [Rhodoglobus sp.]
VLAGLDAVVLSFGVFEALTFLPARRWASGMDALVSAVLERSEPTTHIFVMNCTAPKMSSFAPSYRRHVAEITAAYNEEIRLISLRHDRVHQVDFAPESQDIDAILGRQSYQLWADAIAPSVADVLRNRRAG